MSQKITIALSLLTCAFMAHADSLTFSTGEPGKGYSKIFANINKVCGDKVPMQEVNSNGGLDNLTNLAEKKATIGISQYDTWVSLSGGDEAIGRLRAVVSLNSNLMHIVVRSDGSDIPVVPACSGKVVFGKCVGGDWSPSSVKKVIQTEADLKGLKVAAVGSAQVLARTYLNKKLELGLNIVDVDAAQGKSGDAIALEKLKSGEVQAVISMAAYPSGVINGLKAGDNLTLAGFSKTGGGAYRVVKKNYKSIGAYNTSFLAVPNILWSRPIDPNGDVGKMVTSLKSCIAANLKTMQDKEGFEASWSDTVLTLPDDVPAWSGIKK